MTPEQEEDVFASAPDWWLNPQPLLFTEPQDADSYQRDAIADAQDEDEGEDLG